MFCCISWRNACGVSGFSLDWILCVLYCGFRKALYKKWFLSHGVLSRIAVPLVVLSMGKTISVIMVSGMNEASSQIASWAEYPRSKCSLQGKAIMVEPFVSWMIVRGFRVMLFRKSGLEWVKLRILSNIIMLWRSEGLMISVVVFG